MGTLGLRATGASDSGGGAACPVAESARGAEPWHPASAPTIAVMAAAPRILAGLILPPLLPGCEPVQRIERRQRVYVQAIQLEQQRVGLWGGGGGSEEAQLRRVDRRRRPLLGDVMSRLEQLEHLPRPRHDRVGQSRQAADVN